MGNIMTSVYWIHSPEHTDIFSQGYVGVSNNHEFRWKYHSQKQENAHLRHAIQKYGWDNLVKKVVLIGDEKYCLDIEFKLRPSDKIGWNIVMGGGKPPVRYGNKNRLGVPSWNKGTKGLMPEPWNKGLKLNDEQKAKQFNLAEYMKDKPHGRLGKKLSAESIESMRQKKIGKKQSPESIEKRRAKMTGYKYKIVSCPSCNKDISIISAKRYHFDNCKLKDK
jgi:hypothetical protein